MTLNIGTSGSQAHGPGHTLRTFGKTQELKPFSFATTRQLLSFLKPHTLHLLAATMLMLISSALTLLIPYLTKVVVDTYIANRDLAGINRFLLVASCAFLALAAAKGGQQYLLAWVGQRVLCTLRARLFRHLQRMHLGYHDHHIVGVTLSRVINDVEVINSFLSDGLVNLVGDTFVVAGTVTVMVMMSPTLALVTFSVLPLMVFSTLIFARHARVAYGKTRSSVAAVVGDLAENLAGMRVIQAFAQERSAQNRFEQVTRANLETHVEATSVAFVFLPAVEFIGIIAAVIVLWFGGSSVAAGSITMGTVVAFLSYVTRFFHPIQEISQIYTTMQAAMAGGEKVVELLNTPPEIADSPDAAPLPGIRGKIVLQKVCFEYEKGVPVLKDVDLAVEPGQTVALVGRTGAGKTTVCSLIARFYEVTRGRVLVDDTDVRAITLESLHSQMGIVPQDPFLFSGTVRDNIQFGRPAADLNQVMQAAQVANAHTFISQLPEGYQTTIHGGGVNLSSGQRQLICIARAVLADPRIILLDEATASVDILTERLIQDALRRLLKDRTAVVIAHRLTTVQNADLIYVLERGQVAETGTHGQLLARSGIYSELYERQFVAAAEPAASTPP